MNEVISTLYKDLKIDSAKIISNKNSHESNFFNLMYEAIFINANILDNYKLKVKNKYCNNLFYELSSVSTNSYNLNC